MSSTPRRDMKRILVFLLLFLLIFMTSALAFDGKRQGFVLGAGLGFAPMARWSVNGFDESCVGYGGNVIIGYGWDENNMIVLEDSGAIYESDIFDASVIQQFFGPLSIIILVPKGNLFFSCWNWGLPF